MSRRPLVLLAFSFVALSATACSDATAPAPAAPSVRQIQPSDQPALDVTPPDCRGGYSTSNGRSC